MLLVVVALQVLLLLLVAVLLTRRQAVPAPAADARMLALPDAVIALSAKSDASEAALRNHMAELRREQGEAATQARHAAELVNRALREEIGGSIAQLSKTLNDGLGGFRSDHSVDAQKLRDALQRDLNAMGDRLTGFFTDTSKGALDARNDLHRSLTMLAEKNTTGHNDLRDLLHRSLTGMGQEQRDSADKLRDSVAQGLGKLNTDNAAKLEEMRQTVDEKLQSTLNERLTQSFGQVTTHLGEVQKGLGEMKELATGVSDLKKVFSNVKSRGIVGEFQLGMQLEQMFSPEQYEKNVATRPGSREVVEFALKIPDGDRGHVLLPIDAKFPREDWERLEHAYEHGSQEEQAKAGAAFERAIRTEGKRICEKYINPPDTMPFAVMFLPTEALYAEVMRRPGLHTELQSQCNVTIAGPSSFMAILTSFQMGFRTLAIQKKGNEVWKVLGNVKTEFGKFETLMTKVENNVKTVQNTLSELGVRTRAINRNLRGVSELSSPSAGPQIVFDEVMGVAPLLAAMSDDEEPRA